MRIFVTGATGFVGSAIVQELVGAGHEVLGLARSDEGAAVLGRLGAKVKRGSMDDAESLRSGAEWADGVIHAAFNHDFSKFLENCAQDQRAIEVLGTALEGSDRPLLVTSGLALLASGRLAVETDAHTPDFPRRSEAAASAVAARGVRASAVRLAPSVHGKGDHGFVPFLIALAREKGVAAYIGDGTNRWAGVNRADAARLYRLAMEHGVEGGPYHAIGEEGVPFKEIAGTIGRNLGVPVKSLTREEAAAHFGWMANFAGLDMAASGERTRALLGWTPTGPGLIADMEQAGYFGG